MLPKGILKNHFPVGFLIKRLFRSASTLNSRRENSKWSKSKSRSDVSSVCVGVGRVKEPPKKSCCCCAVAITTRVVERRRQIRFSQGRQSFATKRHARTALAAFRYRGSITLIFSCRLKSVERATSDYTIFK